jgi:NAD(P)-dependent dehydrogenase (short-subunit alcohol dehydrogenase family)
VLILGGSSGVGRSIALAYARREARVCVVGRRGSLLEEVVRDCQAGQAGQVLRVTADISGVEGILAVRDVLERGECCSRQALLCEVAHCTVEWQGVDTVIVVAGVSALRPLMSVAGVDNVKRDFATREGLQYAADVTALAIKGNYVGPLLAAITFVR